MAQKRLRMKNKNGNACEKKYGLTRTQRMILVLCVIVSWGYTLTILKQVIGHTAYNILTGTICLGIPTVVLFAVSLTKLFFIIFTEIDS